MTPEEFKEFDIATAPLRASKYWDQETITWAEVVSWMDSPSSTKEAGNYLFGVLQGRVRNKRSIVSRSMLTLDADYPEMGFVEKFELLLGHRCLIHTTFRSSPDKPRYRIIIPLTRVVSPSEYHALVSIVTRQVGSDQFDKGSLQPERYMFRPAAQRPDWFQHWVIEGKPLDPDEVLEEYVVEDELPSAPRPHPNKRDPLTLQGVVGAFNRVYDLDDLVSAYDLPYEHVHGDRWQLVGASSQAGMGPIADTTGLYYSHHAGDPAGGQTCSAFDLVRLHRFADQDTDDDLKKPVNRRPSHNSMMDLAMADAKVVEEMIGTDFSKDMGSALADWRARLNLNPRDGKMRDEISNWDLITQHDPAFRGLYFNELTMAIETDTDLPWRPLDRPGPVFSGTDRMALNHYLEREYAVRPQRSLVDELVNTVAQQRHRNPLREYLEGLTWDEEPRLEESLPGVRPTPYTRMVARKCLTAAVARVMEPGCKWDHTLVLFGPEGIGKSWWVHKMARGYSASLGRIGDKDTLLTMQRSWIMTSDEGYSLRKADTDIQKEFLTRTEDVFRMPYDREAQAHPRHCVIWGTTNDDVFLRKQEGNRRFLIVRSEDKVDFDLLTDEYIDQIWAEAMHLYRAGEQLFLEESEGTVAAEEREAFTEEDALVGLIEEYLDTLVPADWAETSQEGRQVWLQNRADGLVPAGTEPINQVCSMQVWVEVQGRRIGEHRRTDLLEINRALKDIPGWRPVPGRRRVPQYGPQLVFERIGSNSGHDLI